MQFFPKVDVAVTERKAWNAHLKLFVIPYHSVCSQHILLRTHLDELDVLVCTGVDLFNFFCYLFPLSISFQIQRGPFAQLLDCLPSKRMLSFMAFAKSC